MLYVFHVDNGTMITFDMSHAVESVASLKQQIERICKIPQDKQVLLVSGGECLDPNVKVCTYSAGTDTNPIFLFSKCVIESASPPAPNRDSGSDLELRNKVAESQDLPASYQTVVVRSQIATSMHELAKEQVTVCQNLVHDQHLQQQGWSAVIANLDDITTEFNKRTEIFEKHYRDYLAETETYAQYVEDFKNDLTVLEKIPLLPALLECEQSNQIESQESEDSSEKSLVVKKRPTTLLEWIAAADNKSSMEQLYKNCTKGLSEYDEKLLQGLHEEVQNILVLVDNQDMKEVKGIGDRLFGLEQLLNGAKKIVQEQADLAQSILQNQTRAGNLGDTSILPDLCASHRKQLLVMLQNHQQICDIRQRCTKAKEELSDNIYYRLKWIMFIESSILELDQKLVIHNESIRRLRRQFVVLQQIHLAPAIYLSSVSEVVRRRAFSQAFSLWASDLACHLLTMYNDEVTRRKDFQSQFEGHFLTALFPGMQDVPPNYATQAPSIFDSSLPKLTLEDVVGLKERLPEFADSLSVPDTVAISNFFLVKSVGKGEDLDRVDETVVVEEKLVQAVSEIGLDRNVLRAAEVTAHGLPHLKDFDKGCESETDTEEFEKVGQSPFEKDIPSPKPGSQDASTLTEDNLETSRTEQDKLKSFLVKLASLSNDNITQLKTDLNDLKLAIGDTKSNLRDGCTDIDRLLDTFNRRQREALQRLTVDHELEVSDLRKSEHDKSEEIVRLKDSNAVLRSNADEMRLENESLRLELKEVSERLRESGDELQACVLERERCVKETADKLNREHRAEIESIRSRFRLMTECNSPTDTTSDDSAIKYIRESFEKQAKRDLEISLHHESKKWEKRMEEIQTKYDLMVDEATRTVSEEKEKQIDLLKERERNLSVECLKYKTTIQQLAESDTITQVNQLKARVEELEREKELLVAELEVFRSSAQDLGASVAVFESKVDTSTSPIKHKEKLTKSQTSLIKDGTISIYTCKIGDIVLVLWDQKHESYTILQESNYMFFLHSECVDPLGLKPSANESRKLYCIGEVYDKEYCHARKAENRYRVPKGTRFYRIKVRQMTTLKEIPRKQSQGASTMSQSQSIADADPGQVSETCHSLPATPTKLGSVSESTVTLHESVATTDVYESSLESMTDDGNR